MQPIWVIKSKKESGKNSQVHPLPALQSLASAYHWPNSSRSQAVDVVQMDQSPRASNRVKGRDGS